MTDFIIPSLYQQSYILIKLNVFKIWNESDMFEEIFFMKIQSDKRQFTVYRFAEAGDFINTPPIPYLQGCWWPTDPHLLSVASYARSELISFTTSARICLFWNVKHLYHDAAKLACWHCWFYQRMKLYIFGSPLSSKDKQKQKLYTL